MCFGCSKEPSHWDGSFEYPQHMFWMRNKENSFRYALLSDGLLVSLQGNLSWFLRWKIQYRHDHQLPKIKINQPAHQSLFLQVRKAYPFKVNVGFWFVFIENFLVKYISCEAAMSCNIYQDRKIRPSGSPFVITRLDRKKSVPRFTDLHHEACRVIRNSDPEWRIFLSYPHTNNDFFSCSPLFLFIYLF